MTSAERNLVLQIEESWSVLGADPTDREADEAFSELLSTLIFEAHYQEPLETGDEEADEHALQKPVWVIKP